MNIIQRLFSSAPIKQLFNVTGRFDWDLYQGLIPREELLQQYYGWTKRAIKVKSDTIASNQFTIIQEDGDKEEIITDDILYKDLHHFNPHQTLTEARRLTHIHKFLTGCGFWLVTKSETAGFTREFYILDPTSMYYNTVDQLGFPTSYKYRQRDGKEITIPAESVVVFRSENPEDQTAGSSDVQASSYAHNSYQSAMNFNMNFFHNMARPESMFTLEGASDKQVQAFEKQYNSKFRGTKKAGKVAFMNKKIEMVELTKSIKDMQFTEGIKLMREEILGIHGVPKEIALSSGTYSNVREAQRLFQLYTIQPELDAEADVLTEQLIPAYYGRQLEGLKFKAANAVEADKESDSKIALNMANVEARVPGTFTRNELRDRLDLPAVDDGDDLIVPEQQSKKKDTQALTRFNRDKYIKDVNILRDKGEVSIHLLVEDIFDFQRRAIKANPRDIDVIGLAQRVAKDLTPRLTALATEYSDTYVKHKGMGQQQLSVESQLWINNYTLRNALEFTDTTTKQVSRVIAAVDTDPSMSSGAVNQLVDELFDIYRNPSTGEWSRIDMISRQLVGTVQSRTLNNEIENDPNSAGRQWVSAMDGAVRDAHLAANGQIVGIGEPFLVDSEELMYPMDPNGSPENIMNCRCVEAPV